MTPFRLKCASQLFLFSLAVCGLALTGSLGAQAVDPDRYIVKFVDSARGRAALAAAGGVVVLDLPEVTAAAARIPARALQALASNPNIEYIERDVPRYPLAQTTPYGITMVQADQVSDAGAGSIKVCIIDSGYSLGHEDLSAAVSGTNDSGTGNWTVDSCGHGTHVAGTIAALSNTLGVVGVLPSNSTCAWSR